jgi:hypothetical protein
MSIRNHVSSRLGGKMSRNELIYMFSSKADGFSAKFPKKPQIVNTASNSHYVYNNHRARRGGVGFIITVTDVLVDIKTTEDAIDELQVWADSEVPDMTPLGEPDFKTFHINDLPSVFTVRKNTAQNTIRYDVAVIKDNKLYDISINSVGENKDLFTNFVDNFRF